MPGAMFGIPERVWEAAKKEMKRVLTARAKLRGMISYTDLVGQIKALQLDAFDVRLFTMLGEVSVEEDAAGRGMLSVIVVHKVGDMEPGRGFYELAADLGRDTSDPVKCWIEELHLVHKTWS